MSGFAIATLLLLAMGVGVGHLAPRIAARGIGAAIAIGGIGLAALGCA
jgi:hypothetical protein